MAKISQILSILSFIISASMLGAGVYGYMMVTSDEFKEKMIKQVIDKIPLPEVPKLPKTTGGAMPISNSNSDDTKQFWDYIEKRNKEYIEWETKGKWQ